jgi:hypothetical protein
MNDQGSATDLIENKTVPPDREVGRLSRKTRRFQWFFERWWARQDSNLEPDGYEPSALTIELRAPGGARYSISNAHAIARR